MVVFDDRLDVVFEAPLTLESLQDRLRDRMIAAVADELTEDEVRRFDRGRLLDAIDSAGDQVAGRFERALW